MVTDNTGMNSAVIVAIVVGIFTSVGNVIVSVLGIKRDSREKQRHESDQAKDKELAGSRAKENADRRLHELEALEDRKRELNDLEREAKEILNQHSDRINALSEKQKRKTQLIEDRFQETEKVRIPTTPLPGAVGFQDYSQYVARLGRAKADALLELDEYIQVQTDHIEEDHRKASRMLERVGHERERLRLTENRLRAEDSVEQKQERIAT